MAKRKAEFSLDSFVTSYLKKAKCTRTLKFFVDEKRELETKNEHLLERFMKYLKKKEAEKRNEIDDLGFEINFGAYQPEAKVSSSEHTSLTLSNRTSRNPKIFSCQLWPHEDHLVMLK